MEIIIIILMIFVALIMIFAGNINCNHDWNKANACMKNNKGDILASGYYCKKCHKVKMSGEPWLYYRLKPSIEIERDVHVNNKSKG